jgi:AraC family transcriptional regulator
MYTPSVLPFRPKATEPCATSHLALETSEEGAFGRRMAAYLSPRDRHAVTANTLHSPQLVATSLQCDWGLFGLSDPIPSEKAFIVSVQLKELPFHELRLRGATVQTGYHPKGGVSALDLEEHPRFFFPGSFHCLHFYITRTTLEELADEHHAKRIDTLSWPHAAVDETVSHLSFALLAAFENPVTAGKLFVDHVALALSTHFAYAYGGMRAAARDTRPTLAPWQERRCEELIGDNLARDISLGDLARECRLSVGRFVRAFKQSTGEAPYRWLLKRRVETAKEMLLFSELAIQEIAVACGFADPRRLTRAFTAVVGTAPEVWQRHRGA